MYGNANTERIRTETRSILPNGNDLVTKRTDSRGLQGNLAAVRGGLSDSTECYAANIEARPEERHKAQSDGNGIDISSLPSLAISSRYDLPEHGAIYFVLDSGGKIEYIGQTKNLRQRWRDGHGCCADLESPKTSRIAWSEVANEAERKTMEVELIQRHKPRLNYQHIPIVKLPPPPKVQVAQQLFTTNEAAEMLGVTPARVRQMVLRDEIEAVKMGRDNFVTQEAIDRAKQRKTQRGPALGSKQKPEAVSA